MCLTITKNNRAKQLSWMFRPIIYQEFESYKDLITRILVKKSDRKIESVLKEARKPTIYYSVLEDSSFYYIYYMVYHPFDWSKFPIPCLRSLDEHDHDTEGILLRVHKSNPVDKHLPVNMVTVAHNTFLVQPRAKGKVCIKSGSHAIYPYEQSTPITNHLIYYDYKLENMRKWSNKEWERMRACLKGVNMPDEQFCSAWLSTEWHSVGDIWNFPNKIFDLAFKFNLI